MCVCRSVLLEESRQGKGGASYVALTPVPRTHAVRVVGEASESRYGSFTEVPDQSLLSHCCLGNILKVKLNPVKQVLRACTWIGISGFGAELVSTLNYHVTHSSNICEGLLCAKKYSRCRGYSREQKRQNPPRA